MLEFHHLGNKLLDRAAQVLVVTEIAVGSEERDAVGFANVGTLHQHIHGGGVGQQLCLVIAHLVCMVVVANVVMVMGTESI